MIAKGTSTINSAIIETKLDYEIMESNSVALCITYSFHGKHFMDFMHCI